VEHRPAVTRTSGGPWLIVAAHDPAAADGAVATLQELLAPIQGRDPPAGEAPGAVVFDRVDDDLLTFIREMSRAGSRRVLAIATDATALEGASAWRLLDAGAADALAWDGQPEAIAARIARWRAVDELVGSPLVTDHLIGSSPAWCSVVREIVEVAHFSDLNVLITGESGTGKELTARLIHALDTRPHKGELVVVDCTTIVPTLSGSELFGHERGAFTGADVARDGAFALADGGTLFLDEVGELPGPLQAELLRVVQEGTYKRLGSNRWRTTRFRLVCATNRDLATARAKDEFRADLFFRLAAATIELPCLHDRPQDILALARHFIAGEDKRTPAISEPVCDLLLAREYPGNVRDLKQLISRIQLRHVGPGPVTVGDVPPPERPSAGGASDWRADLESALHRAVALGVPLREIVDATRDAAIGVAMASADGNLHGAARRLGVTDRTLQLHRARRRQGT
jgi:transcriptional regulator with GAF, ATPase, and Fis domain